RLYRQPEEAESLFFSFLEIKLKHSSELYVLLEEYDFRGAGRKQETKKDKNCAIIPQFTILW
ncbi:hypothetical protein EDM56_24790, partial [Brevibacillus fluminis]